MWHEKKILKLSMLNLYFSTVLGLMYIGTLADPLLGNKVEVGYCFEVTACLSQRLVYYFIQLKYI